jgi:hypothetical protein
VVNEVVPVAQPPASEPRKDIGPSNQRAASAPSAGQNAASDVVADAKNVVPTASSQKLTGKESERSQAPQPKKQEELVTDRVVQLPGAMPRPAAPPAVRQEADRKAAADFAAKAGQAPAAQVLGRVLDAATGAPVVGALVSIDTTQLAARTDSTGKFQLQSVPLGNQTVRVRALGFQPAQQPIAVASSDGVQQLAFTLQKSPLELSNVVVTGTAASAQQDRRDAQGARRAAEQQQPLAREQAAQVSAARSRSESAAGCYTLVAQTRDKARDEDRAILSSLPTRIQLESELVDRSRANEASPNRARTLSGTMRAESWRLVADSLEITFTDGDRRHALRFVKRDTRWISDIAILEPCSVR